MMSNVFESANRIYRAQSEEANEEKRLQIALQIVGILLLNKKTGDKNIAKTVKENMEKVFENKENGPYSKIFPNEFIQRPPCIRDTGLGR